MAKPATASRLRTSGSRFRRPWLDRALDDPSACAAVGGAGTAALVVVLSFVFAPLVGGTVITLALINLVAVVGLGLFTGNSGVLSLGHAAFFGLGAYVSGLLTMDPAIKQVAVRELPSWLAGFSVPFGVALLVTPALVGLAALLLGLPIVRLPGISAAIASLGVLVIVHTVLLAAKQFTNGAGTFYGVSTRVGVPLTLSCAAGAIVLARVFRDSVLGLQLRASREDDVAARSMGVRLAGYRLIAWVLSAMLGALAGVLYAHFIGSFSPNAFYFDLTLTLIIMLIVGGRNTVLGAVVGVVAVTTLVEILRRVEVWAQSSFWPDLVGLTQIGLAASLLAIVILKPSGLVGRLELDELVGALYRRRARVLVQ